MIDQATFRDVMSQWPSGVTVVTTLAADGSPHGMTASSFSSVSLDPPLVSICLTTTLYTHELIKNSGVFGISVLAKDQQEVGRRFAGMDPTVTDRFAGEQWAYAETGVPLLDSALGWFDCRVVHAYPGGDHTIFVGEVLAGHAAGKSAPLLFHSRGWGQFADVLPDIATLSDSGVVAGVAGSAAGVPAAPVAAGVAEAGVRVRIADLTAATSAADAQALLPRTYPLDAASVLVADRAQADLALEAGVAVVERELDPLVPGALEEVLASLAGIEARSAVILRDPFSDECHESVLAAVRALGRAGVAEIGLPDSAGSATPLQVRGLLQEVVALARPVPVRMNLHDRDRLGLVKAITALKSGVRHFDTTLAGLDGAVATEDLIRLLEEVDVDTSVDSAALVALAGELRTTVAGAAADAPDLPLSASTDATEIVGAAG
ncbi:flavin reductase [Nocardioides sp. zg-536]|uniref:Flavin reductase n=1 Tax=Nocardioides faecalis TaxID=2803858 RepID=A0A939BXB9_9ACTN|nr:flavin reductase [Nocardioides faecalis]MBM9459193.1 flavin reductase [Nocardioides faecalis]MBS4751441.1 flavin reductase [Nocardioides faecalis]QVI59667.1 flavin reductase [Nocardioides faecalis]